MKKRLFTVCRITAHWTTGAVIGSICATNQWNKWSTVFLVMHIIVQLLAMPINPYKRK